jgi:hypothetical protein
MRATNRGGPIPGPPHFFFDLWIMSQQPTSRVDARLFVKENAPQQPQQQQPQGCPREAALSQQQQMQQQPQM